MTDVQTRLFRRPSMQIINVILECMFTVLRRSERLSFVLAGLGD